MAFRTIVGDIVKTKSEIAVNALGCKNDFLSFGVVCRAYIKEAQTQSLENDLKLNYDKGVFNAGDSFITSGYENIPNELYHVCVPKYPEDTNLEFLTYIIKNLLISLHKKGYKRISLPLVGTGGCQYPRSLVYDLITSLCSVFCDIYPDFTIILVINQLKGTTYKDCKDVYDAIDLKTERIIKPLKFNFIPSDFDYNPKPILKKELPSFSDRGFYNDRYESAGVFIEPMAFSTVDAYVRLYFKKKNYSKEQIINIKNKINDWLGSYLNKTGNVTINRTSGSKAYSHYKELSKEGVGIKPSKENVFKIAMALELTSWEADDFFEYCQCGFSISDSRDSIFRAFFDRHFYSLIEVYDILKHFNCKI